MYSNDLLTPLLFHFCGMSLVFLTHVECLVRVVVILGVKLYAFSTLCAWRAVFSPTLLCVGLLPSVTIVSDGRFYHVFQFHSFMVNTRYCTVSAICAHMMYDVEGEACTE